MLVDIDTILEIDTIVPVVTILLFDLFLLPVFLRGCIEERPSLIVIFFRWYTDQCP